MAFKGQNFNGSNGKDKSSRLSPTSNSGYIFRFELEVSFFPFFTIQCWLSNVKHLKKARSPNIATSSSMLASANAFAVPANTTSLHSVASSRVVTVFGYYLVAKNSIKSEINRKAHSLLPPKSSFKKFGSGEDRILSNFFPVKLT